MVALKTGPKKCFWGGGEELPSHFVNCSIDLESLPIVWFWGDILMHWHIDWCRQWYFRHHQDHLHHSSWYGSYHKINCGRAFFIFNLSSSLFHFVSFSGPYQKRNCGRAVAFFSSQISRSCDPWVCYFLPSFLVIFIFSIFTLFLIFHPRNPPIVIYILNI